MACLLMQPSLAQPPNYDLLDETLARNVKSGFVDYDGIRTEPVFEAFIKQLAITKPGALTNQQQELAFFINAYNALAIQGVLDGASPSSWWGRRTFFKRISFDVLGEKMTLEALEHGKIIPLGDPRIHFAIVCASLSCPRLSGQAYRPDTLNEQLHNAAVQFINDPTRNRFDPERRIAFLSKIFDWYSDDFVNAGGSLQRYLARFTTDAKTEDLLRKDGFEIRFTEYDWNLNGRNSNN